MSSASARREPSRSRVSLPQCASLPQCVSLPMYNLPEMRGANTAFWRAMRGELATLGLDDTPEALVFDRPPVPARIGDDMLFTQVCGWPLHTIYAGQAVILGVPVYDAPFCKGATHAGVFVVHRDSAFRELADLRGSDFVFNSLHSNSGMNLPRRRIADIAGGQKFFGRVRETGSHPDNLTRVADSEAEATCVDSVTYAFVAAHRPAIAGRLRMLAPTPPSPAIPFVTAAATPPYVRERLGEALMRVARAPEHAAVRAGLKLRDVVAPVPGAYDVLLRTTAEARQLGYPELV